MSITLQDQAILGQHFERTTLDPTGQHAAWEHGTCVAMMEVLLKHYPGYDWQVKANVGTGMAAINLPFLMRQSFGYQIRLEQLNDATVLRGAGELLERFKLDRARANAAKYREAQSERRLLGIHAGVPGGFKGETKRPTINTSNAITVRLEDGRLARMVPHAA
jgi:hypothetical protein